MEDLPEPTFDYPYDLEAANSYWGAHGTPDPEVWTNEFERWTQGNPDALIRALEETAPWAIPFFETKVLQVAAGGWIRHLSPVPGLEQWFFEENMRRAYTGKSPLPWKPPIQVRTDYGETALDGDGIPFKGQPILTQFPPQIAHCRRDQVTPGHGPWGDPTAVGIMDVPIIGSDPEYGQYDVSWWHNPEAMKLADPELFEEHNRVWGCDGETKVRHHFLLLTNGMEDHINNHEFAEYGVPRKGCTDCTGAGTCDNCSWLECSHHGTPTFDVHRHPEPGKYLMIPKPKVDGEPWHHQHEYCEAKSLLLELEKIQRQIRGTGQPEIVFPRNAQWSHNEIHPQEFMAFLKSQCQNHTLGPDGCRCGYESEWNLLNHNDKYHRISRRCGEEVTTRVSEKCLAPKADGTPCQLYLGDNGCRFHGTQHSGATETRPCGAWFPCPTHDEEMDKWDPRRFEEKTGVHEHKGRKIDDPDAPNPAERIHCPKLTADRLATADLVYFVMEAAHKACATAYFIWKNDPDNTGVRSSVVSVASVTLWQGVPEFEALCQLLNDKIVVLVCDNDHYLNPLVIAATEGCRQKILKYSNPLSVLIAAPPHKAKDLPSRIREKLFSDLEDDDFLPKWGVDDWLGTQIGGTLGELVVRGRYVDENAIVEWVMDRFIESEYAYHRQAKFYLDKLCTLAKLLANLAGREPLREKDCEKCGNVTHRSGWRPEGIPNSMVAPPLSTIESILGKGWGKRTASKYIGMLDSLGFIKPSDWSDPTPRRNKRTGEWEVTKTQFYNIQNPEHQPEDAKFTWLENIIDFDALAALPVRELPAAPEHLPYWELNKGVQE